MGNSYYVVVKGSIVVRQYYRWSDEANAVVWQNGPFRCTKWHVREEAEAVAALHAGARVLRRTI